MLKKEFKPKYLYDLLRVGKNNDGGYLAESNSIQIAQSLISFGIGKDWSFEIHFKKIKNIPIFAYDHTIEKFEELPQFKIFFNANKSNYFFRKKIVETLVEKNNTNIKTILNDLNLYFLGLKSPIFFKIDIEGSEYIILNDLVKFSKSISGLLIEFHDVPANLNTILKFIKEIDLDLCHIHANNWGGVDSNMVPKVIELTFARDPVKIDDKSTVPHILDQRNNPRKEDITINFEQN
jgi:hypothetical protein